jgi:hypothetical protein
LVLNDQNSGLGPRETITLIKLSLWSHKFTYRLFTAWNISVPLILSEVWLGVNAGNLLLGSLPQLAKFMPPGMQQPGTSPVNNLV